MRTVITIEGNTVTVEVDDNGVYKLAKEEPAQTLTLPDESPVVSRPQVPITSTDKQIRVCAVCGKDFVAKHALVKMCSDECRKIRQKQQINKAKGETFLDPWDCGNCRSSQTTCAFHLGMEDDGKEPPKYRLNQ